MGCNYPSIPGVSKPSSKCGNNLVSPVYDNEIIEIIHLTSDMYLSLK